MYTKKFQVHAVVLHVLLHTDVGLGRHHPLIYGDVLIRLEICLADSHYLSVQGLDLKRRSYSAVFLLRSSSFGLLRCSDYKVASKRSRDILSLWKGKLYDHSFLVVHSVMNVYKA